LHFTPPALHCASMMSLEGRYARALLVLSAAGAIGIGLAVALSPRPAPPDRPTNAGPPPQVDHADVDGGSIYRTFCATCHSADGTRIVGPSMLGLFRRTPEG
jgi:cytochrome c5